MLPRGQEIWDRKVNAASAKVVIKLDKSSYYEMVRTEANQIGQNTEEKKKKPADKKATRGVPIEVQWKPIQLRSMRMWI